MLSDEFIIVHLGVDTIDAVDRLSLAGAEGFVGVETPNAFEQPLTTKDLVNAGDAAGVVVRHIKKRGVGVGCRDGQAKQIRRDAFRLSRGVMAFVQEIDRATSPDGPMAQQPSDDPSLDRPGADREPIRGEQVEHDVIVVTRVECDVVTPGFGHGPDDVKTSVSVERSDLDGDDRASISANPRRQK